MDFAHENLKHDLVRPGKRQTLAHQLRLASWTEFANSVGDKHELASGQLAAPVHSGPLSSASESFTNGRFRSSRAPNESLACSRSNDKMDDCWPLYKGAHLHPHEFVLGHPLKLEAVKPLAGSLLANSYQNFRHVISK